MKPRLEGQLRRLAVLVFWIIVWALAAAAVGQELLLPGPLQVAHRLAALAGTVDFWLTLVRSILRVLTGIVSAVFLLLMKSPFGETQQACSRTKVVLQESF